MGTGTLELVVNQYQSAIVRITRGLGAGQEQQITGNTATVITVGQPWVTEPDATSFFVIAENSWRTGNSGKSSPLTIDVPERIGQWSADIGTGGGGGGGGDNAERRRSCLRMIAADTLDVGRIGRSRCGFCGASRTQFCSFGLAGNHRVKWNRVYVAAEYNQHHRRNLHLPLLR